MATKLLPGAVDASPTPKADKQHVWETSWLSDGSSTCKACGVELLANVILADKPGLPFHYRDAYNQVIDSMVELPCPLFIGQTNGAVADAKVRVRRLDGRVQGVEGKVQSIEDRLASLEAENAELRARVDEKREVDVNALMGWIAEMSAAYSQAGLPSVAVQVRGLPYEVPQPVADMLVRSSELVEVPAEDPDDILS